MVPDFSLIVGGDGALAKSGRTIYDSLHDNPECFLPSTELGVFVVKHSVVKFQDECGILPRLGRP